MRKLHEGYRYYRSARERGPATMLVYRIIDGQLRYKSYYIAVSNLVSSRMYPQWQISVCRDFVALLARWPQYEEIDKKTFITEARNRGYIVTCRDLK